MFQTQWLFLTLRVVRSEGVLFLVLKTLRVVRQWSSPLSGHASLSFHMIHKFPGTIFSASSYWISLISCNNILISIKKDAEHISVGTRYFPTTQINDPVLQHFRKYPWASPYVRNVCLWKLYFQLYFLCLLFS